MNRKLERIWKEDVVIKQVTVSALAWKEGGKGPGVGTSGDPFGIPTDNLPNMN
jgi:hypothetical protein